MKGSLGNCIIAEILASTLSSIINVALLGGNKKQMQTSTVRVLRRTSQYFLFWLCFSASDRQKYSKIPVT